MIQPKDITVGMKVFVVNCKKKTVIPTEINFIDPHTGQHLCEQKVGISNVVVTNMRELLQCLNTDTSKDIAFYGLELSTSTTRFYVSLSEKDAYRHLIDNVLRLDMETFQDRADDIRETYLGLVDKIGAIEKKREELKEKLDKL
jgi:hypothetical protein